MYCKFCDNIYTINYYSEFCSLDCMKNFYSQSKLLDSLSKSFTSNASIKIFDDIETKLINISSKRRLK